MYRERFTRFKSFFIFFFDVLGVIADIAGLIPVNKDYYRKVAYSNDRAKFPVRKLTHLSYVQRYPELKLLSAQWAWFPCDRSVHYPAHCPPCSLNRAAACGPANADVASRERAETDNIQLYFTITTW